VAQRPASLLRAARTATREDRLTEIFRIVLDGNPDVARRVLREACLPSEGQVEVYTQVRTRLGKRVDLELVALDTENRIAGRLWSEHKTGSGYSPDQLPNYAAELAEFPGKTQLITIIDEDQLEDGDDDPRWKRLTWRWIARMLTEVGRAEDGPDWRQRANSRDALARQRLLHELLTYLEEEHGTVLDPISHLDVIAFARANRTSDLLVAVMERAAEQSSLTPDGQVDFSPKDDWGAFWQCFERPGSWGERLEGYAELHARDEDLWAYPRVGEPAFGAGFTLPGKYYDVLRNSANSDWLQAVEGEGFSVADVDGYHARVYRTKYVAELISAGGMDAQATALARWMEESVYLLEKHDPGVQPVPDPPKRRGRRMDSGATDDAEGTPPTTGSGTDS
jgi:hypothetical protein